VTTNAHKLSKGLIARCADDTDFRTGRRFLDRRSQTAATANYSCKFAARSAGWKFVSARATRLLAGPPP
jgi:hypothetical protein